MVHFYEDKYRSYPILTHLHTSPEIDISTSSKLNPDQKCKNVIHRWRRSIVVRTLVSAGELSLSHARLLAGWVTTLWLSSPLSVGQLSHPSLRGR